MRWILASVLFLFAFAAQANSFNSYVRSLRYLGFDNKRIGRIAKGLAKANGIIGEDDPYLRSYILVTKKFAGETQGYQFFETKNFALTMQKIDSQAGEIGLGQLTTIDPNLPHYPLVLDELAGLTGKDADQAIQRLLVGEKLKLIVAEDDPANRIRLSLEIDGNGMLSATHYLEIDNIRMEYDSYRIDWDAIRRKEKTWQERKEFANSHQQLLTLLGQIIDHNNRRLVAEVAEELKQPVQEKPQIIEDLKQASEVPTTNIRPPIIKVGDERFFVDNIVGIAMRTEKNRIAELFGYQDHVGLRSFLNSQAGTNSTQLPLLPDKFQLTQLEEIISKELTSEEVTNFVNEVRELSLARQQRLLPSLFASESQKEQVQLLSEILHVRTADIRELFPDLGPIAVRNYRRGTMPRYVERRQKLGELYRQKIATSYLDGNEAEKVSELIDEIYQLESKAVANLVDDFDPEVPQQFFNGRSLNKVAADKRQGEVFMSYEEIESYRDYLERTALELTDDQVIPLLKKHADSLEVELPDSDDWSKSIDEYLSELQKLVTEHQINYTPPAKEIGTVSQLKKPRELIDSLAKGKDSYRQVADGVIVTKNFANEFSSLRVEDHKNSIVKAIERTSDSWQKWKPGESLLAYLMGNVSDYNRASSPPNSQGLLQLRIGNKHLRVYIGIEGDQVVLASLTTQESNQQKAIDTALSSLQKLRETRLRQRYLSPRN